MTLMHKYKEMEAGIKDVELEVEKLNKDQLSTSVKLAVSRTKFQIITENVSGLKEKLANVTKLHKNCSI